MTQITSKEKAPNPHAYSSLEIWMYVSILFYWLLPSDPLRLMTSDEKLHHDSNNFIWIIHEPIHLNKIAQSLRMFHDIMECTWNTKNPWTFKNGVKRADLFLFIYNLGSGENDLSQSEKIIQEDPLRSLAQTMFSWSDVIQNKHFYILIQ